VSGGDGDGDAGGDAGCAVPAASVAAAACPPGSSGCSVTAAGVSAADRSALVPEPQAASANATATSRIPAATSDRRKFLTPHFTINFHAAKLHRSLQITPAGGFRFDGGSLFGGRREYGGKGNRREAQKAKKKKKDPAAGEKPVAN
jgi:hypothetical protein